MGRDYEKEMKHCNDTLDKFSRIDFDWIIKETKIRANKESDEKMKRYLRHKQSVLAEASLFAKVLADKSCKYLKIPNCGLKYANDEKPKGLKNITALAESLGAPLVKGLGPIVESCHISWLEDFVKNLVGGSKCNISKGELGFGLTVFIKGEKNYARFKSPYNKEEFLEILEFMK